MMEAILILGVLAIGCILGALVMAMMVNASDDKRCRNCNYLKMAEIVGDVPRVERHD